MDDCKIMCAEHKRMSGLIGENWSEKCQYIGCRSDAHACRRFPRMTKHQQSWRHHHNFSTMACKRHLCVAPHCHFPRTEYGIFCSSHSDWCREGMTGFSLSGYGRILPNELVNLVCLYMSGGVRMLIGIVTDRFTSKHAFELTVRFTWRLTSRIDMEHYGAICHSTNCVAIYHQTNGFVDLPLTPTQYLLCGETYSVVLPKNVQLPRRGSTVYPCYFFVLKLIHYHISNYGEWMLYL